MNLWRSWLIRQHREVLAPITQEGVMAKEIHSKGGRGGHVSAGEFAAGARPEEFTPSTVILSGGYAAWELLIPSYVRTHLIDATLRIETVRTHGTLHSPKPGTSASVFVNDQLVDKIYLVKPHPHGEEFGVDSRRPFPILRYLDLQREVQAVRIEVDHDVSWDIDRISIEPIVLSREITPGASMILGAIISAALGVGASYLLQSSPGSSAAPAVPSNPASEQTGGEATRQGQTPVAASSPTPNR